MFDDREVAGPIDPVRRWRLDLGKIQQVLLNLPGNATEHSGAHA